MPSVSERACIAQNLFHIAAMSTIAPAALRLLEADGPDAVSTRAVSAAGNEVARQTLADVFAVTDRQWRGIGMIPRSGWTLSPRYAEFDAGAAKKYVLNPNGYIKTA